ncbi:DUF6415 family natural product biosynthesis protein [Streptomyces sp. V4-01]|uniref:DUF6415 family natural product biosynthesis protein n=1 Tax=Actinacidiphila polyblastidii TaxID=3110430 RepID=A0ABU7PDW9_9ACTN|nr:DUF6415 family natural product biosynthesis protein [Streptomyces sp. V4-01]
MTPGAGTRTWWPTGPESEEPAVSRWLPPLDAAGLTDVLGLLRRWAWTGADSEALLDDVATALDDVAPCEEDVEEIVQRLRGHLMRLVDIAVSARVWQTSAYADTLIQRARVLRAEEMPDDHRRAVAHLRRMAWILGDLLDQLVTHDSVKGAA